MTIQEFLGRLEGVQAHGGHWGAKCPAHEDRHASLSVTEGRKGVLVKCHAGCSVQEILREMGLSAADLFFEPMLLPASKNGSLPHRKAEAGRIVATYGYTDAEGALRHETVRYEPKRFKQRRPDGRGGFHWNLEGVSLVLYRLPAVLDAVAAGVPIWIVEGEKDADALANIGLVATCAAMGAGKWRPEYSEQLRGASCVLLPDNDEAGRRHVFGGSGMLGVAPSLHAAGCRVRVIELPGLPAGGDVSDWIAAGNGALELVRLGKTAVDWMPAPIREAPPQLTDLGNAFRLLTEHGVDLRYCDVWNDWLVWDKTRWQRDRTRNVETRAHRTILRLYHAAPETADVKEAQAQAKFALASQSDKAITAMVRRARALDALKAVPEQFDVAPWLFNAANGTVDLTTGKLLPHRREDYLTQLCPVSFHAEAEAPRWRRFLLEIMGGDPALVAFLQRAVGYSISGSDRERVLLILYGSGANGKSTFLDLIRKMMGDYGHKLRRETLTLHRMRPGQASPEIAGLRGKRFAYLSETEEGGRIDEALVKELTGREYIQTRNLYEKEFGFTPEFTLWAGTNHKPVIHGTDEAIWSRLPLVPFPVRFADPGREKVTEGNPLLRPMDRTLAEALGKELPGILAWAVEGCLAWQRQGLAIPETVLHATQEYRAESDFIQAFLDENTVKAFGMRCRVRDCHLRYMAWSANNAAPNLSQRKLSPLLVAKGFTQTMGTDGYFFWDGFGLQDE